MYDGDLETLCSLRWHYPDQVRGVDTLRIEAHPLSRNISSPNTLGLICGCYAAHMGLSTRARLSGRYGVTTRNKSRVNRSIVFRFTRLVDVAKFLQAAIHERLFFRRVLELALFPHPVNRLTSMIAFTD